MFPEGKFIGNRRWQRDDGRIVDYTKRDNVASLTSGFLRDLKRGEKAAQAFAFALGYPEIVREYATDLDTGKRDYKRIRLVSRNYTIEGVEPTVVTTKTLTRTKGADGADFYDEVSAAEDELRAEAAIALVWQRPEKFGDPGLKALFETLTEGLGLPPLKAGVMGAT